MLRSRRSRMSSTRAHRSVVAGVAGIMLALAGCGGGGGGGSAPSKAGEATTLRIGFIPVVQSAPLYIANQQGYFQQENLRVELSPLQNAASIVPSVLNGQLQLGTAATVPFVAAVEKGLPIQAIATAGNRGAKEAAIVAKRGSGIRTPRDLAGKTVAVNQLNAVLQLVTLADIAKSGGDPAKTKFIALPFPDALSAVESGQVDAATVVEPFVTLAGKQALEVVANPYADVLPEEANIAVSFVSKQYLAEHRAALAGFVRAVDRATKYAAENPEAVRQAVTKYTEITPELAKTINLPAYVPSLTPASIEPTLRLMEQFKFVPKAPDAASLIATP